MQSGLNPLSIYYWQAILKRFFFELFKETGGRRQNNKVMAFADDWVNYFYQNEDLWPVTHRKKSQHSWRKYDYDIKQKSNLFNLDSLYRNMPKKPFTKGRKQEFEVLMTYFWLHNLVGDGEGYWQEYLSKVLPTLKQE